MNAAREKLRARFLGIVLPTLLLVAAACGQGQSGSPGSSPDKNLAASTPAQPAGSALSINVASGGQNTFDSRYLQIDECPNVNPPFPSGFNTDGLGNSTTPGCGGNWGGDANLWGPSHVGNAGSLTNQPGVDTDTLLSIGKTAMTPQPLPSLSTNLPAPLGGKTGTYIDWLDLTGNATDFGNHFNSDAVGSDPSSFPLSNSCVGTSNVLSKMDLTFVSVSNNIDYAYFGVQRRDNSGDAGYMWMFNRVAPPSFNGTTNDAIQLAENCGTGLYALTFRVSTGDVLFRGHFAPSSSEPLLTVYKVNFAIDTGTTVQDGNVSYTANCPGGQGTSPCYVEMPAKSAINWTITVNNGTTTLYTGLASNIAGAAVNTSIAGVGALGDTSQNSVTGGIGITGLKSPMANGDNQTIGNGSSAQVWQCKDPNGCMEENLFAEVAVPISTFLSGGSACGATFYGSVISRSSGTTPSPDMKDLAGPFQYNFGNAAVTETVAPTCGATTSSGQFTYQLGTFTGITGETVPPSSLTCIWCIDATTCDSSTPACSGSTIPAGGCAFSTTCSTTAANVPNALLTSLGNGAHTVKLSATDGQCPAASGPASVTVYPLPQVGAYLTGQCDSTLYFTYKATDSTNASNTSPSYFGTPTFTWGFTGGYTASNVTQSTAGPFTVSSGITAATTINASVTLSDDRSAAAAGGITTGACTASGTGSTKAYLNPSVTLLPTAASPQCSTSTGDSTFDTTGAFTATAKDGSGSYTYAWTKTASGSATITGCAASDGPKSGSSSCSINESSLTCAYDSVGVTVTDSVCTSVTPSASGTYTKLTSVTATVP